MNFIQRITTSNVRVNSAIPAPPVEFAASVISSSQIDLTWIDDSYNETGFEIHHSTTSPTAGFSLLYTTTADEESYSHTGLTEGTTHYYKLRAVNANGESDYVESSGTTLVPAPTNLDASTVSSSQINLTWDDNSSTETGFEVFRSTDGATFTLIHTTAANVESYNNTGLDENTTYYYQVRAAAATLRSEPSNTANATTSPALNAPSDLTATAVSSSQINLEWTDNSSNETGFEIERSTSSGSGFSNIATTSPDVTTYSDTGRTASTTYYYRVRAINAEGSTAYTSEASATTTATGTVPSAPTNLIATGAGNTNITLSWSDNSSNETGFQIERSVDNNSAFSLLTTTAAGANSYNDTGLNEGRRYYYRIRATNGSGNSAYTNQVNEITTWSSPITYVGKGTAGASSTSTVAIPYPSGITAGAIIACVIGTKTNKTIVETPSGWVTGSGDGFIDYFGGAGGGQGSITANVFLKFCTGSESGSQNFTVLSTPNSAYGIMYLVSKDSNAFWSYDIVAGSHRDVSTTAYSATSWEKISTIKGDAILAVTCLNFVVNASAQAMTQSGVSIATTSAEINDSSTTTGNDQSQIASLFHVTGNTSISQKCVHTMTLSTSTSVAPIGITVFIRLRNARTQPTYNPMMRRLRAADIVHTSNTATDPLSIFDGHRISAEGPDSYATKYSIATFNGRPCIKIVADLTTGLNRRTEFSNNWQPPLGIGSQIIQEHRFETDATASEALGEILFYQNHPGSAPGQSSNHPTQCYGWTYNGQKGFTGEPGSTESPGGELMVANQCKVSGVYIRKRFPSITWGPNKVYRIRMHVRADIATGQPVFKFWASVDGGAMNLLYEDYEWPTVTSTESELGVPTFVLGAQKVGVYHHMVTNESTRLANIAAGHTGVITYYPCINRITMLPNDSFAAGMDLEDNNNPYYDLVSTASE